MTRRLLLAAVLLCAAASQWSAAFDGYDTDTWTYRLIVERIAGGAALGKQDPFLLQPPPAPHVTAYWYALGLLRRTLPIDGGLLLRGFGLGSLALLTVGAWRVAGELLGSRGQVPAVLLFWLIGVGTWPETVLGRNVGWGCALLALAALLRGRRAPRPPWAIASWTAAAFYAHPFAGVIAIGALVLAAASVRQELSWRPRAIAAMLLVLLVLIAPGALQAAALARAEGPSSAHRVRPGVVAGEDWRALSIGEGLRLVPPALLLLLVVGLLVPVPPEQRAAQRLSRGGTALVALVLFTPLYHLATTLVGGWMVERLLALAFVWIAATLGLEFLTRGPRAGTVTAMILVLGIAANAAFVFAESFLDRPLRLSPAVESAVRPLPRGERRDGRPRLFYRFATDAQEEARSLRDRLAGRAYVSEPLLAYGLAAPTLGRPLAVPPGHAAPTAEFVRRARRVDAVLESGRVECWAGLAAEFPELEFLVTPAPGAEVEGVVWAGRKGKTAPERTRRLLADAGILQNEFSGRFFVVDRLRGLGDRPSLGCGGTAR